MMSSIAFHVRLTLQIVASGTVAAVRCVVRRNG